MNSIKARRPQVQDIDKILESLDPHRKIDGIESVIEALHLLRMSIMPQLVDLASWDEPCPLQPKFCDTDCQAWRGQSDGLGYCAQLNGDFGDRI